MVRILCKTQCKRNVCSQVHTLHATYVYTILTRTTHMVKMKMKVKLKTQNGLTSVLCMHVYRVCASGAYIALNTRKLVLRCIRIAINFYDFDKLLN